MLHAYDQRFDVTENLENFCKLNKAKSVRDWMWREILKIFAN